MGASHAKAGLEAEAGHGFRWMGCGCVVRVWLYSRVEAVWGALAGNVPHADGSPLEAVRSRAHKPHSGTHMTCFASHLLFS